MPNYYDFQAFQSYTIGYGALRDLRRLTAHLGNHYLVVHDSHMNDVLERTIRCALADLSAAPHAQGDNLLGRAAGLMDDLGEPIPDVSLVACKFMLCEHKACTIKSARELGERVSAANPEVVVAVGSSKLLDLARAALHFGGVWRRPALVLVPTIVASNASSNGISIMYSEDRTQMVDFWNVPAFPECQIVDTELISKAPAEFIVAAIGDQVSSSVEAVHTVERFNKDLTWDPLCAMHHEDVLEVLREHAAAAVEAARRHEVTPEFEWVLHACTRYTGEQLAVAASFLSHVLDEALIGIPEVTRVMHGLVVGYGVLPEMVAFGTPEEIPGWVALYRKIGIPCTLAELAGREVPYEELLACCEAAADKIMASRALVRFTPREMADAVVAADRIVVGL